ncbi:hypothetical protein [Microvirga tunisiensis]
MNPRLGARDIRRILRDHVAWPT